MATMQKQGDQDKKMKNEGQPRAEGDIGSPISNDAYNIVAALHNKLEGLDAYRKYSKDGDAQVWRDLTQQDIRCVEILVDELERLVKDGKFRQMHRPGTKA
jgi:hypothetical protein